MTTVYIDKRPTYSQPKWAWVVINSADGYEFDAFDRKMDALAWCIRNNLAVEQKKA